VGEQKVKIKRNRRDRPDNEKAALRPEWAARRLIKSGSGFF
jgi:hypothetical protein